MERLVERIGICLFNIAKRIERLNKFMIAFLLLLTLTIDVAITTYIYHTFPNLFFRYEANLLFRFTVMEKNITTAITYILLMDSVFLILLLLPYRFVRTLAFSKALLHLMGLNWLLIAWFNVFIGFISLINIALANFCVGLIVASFFTSDDFFNDLMNKIESFKRKFLGKNDQQRDNKSA